MTTRILAGLVLGLALLTPVWSGAEEKVVELAITGRKLATPSNVVRVRQGDTVELRWTTDEVAELHLHGYDVEVVVRPGAPAPMKFIARATGRFPVTAHRFGARTKGSAHGHDEITLLYLEVLPR